jgi:hypothetical protein
MTFSTPEQNDGTTIELVQEQDTITNLAGNVDTHSKARISISTEIEAVQVKCRIVARDFVLLYVQRAILEHSKTILLISPELLLCDLGKFGYSCAYIRSGIH